MPIHAEKRIVPYTPQQMYGLVADVPSYSDFLPWIKSVRVYRKTSNGFDADLSIGTSLISQSYTSKVTLQPDVNRIDVVHTKGPFRYLDNYWIFNSHEKGAEIDFHLDFELDNSFLKPILQPFLNQAVLLMVNAFQKRAEELFGVK